ncbi:DUF1573 domain-containing protein [Butyricimonas synergistica]|uniref:DUF1573 domain-containing protein n=1 Tax=Butyricimonas synergistica TaxID=544644 RepID=UPI000475FAAD|nr:DUF1573 domain-containing protein [Butyricimonas synergistica]
MIRLGKILAYSIFFLLPALAVGQKAKIDFEKTVLEAGLVQETGGKITYHFKFVNKGKAPLLIKYVETTCGCTVPKWNRRPIMPRDSGVISVVFNPKDRPGTFSKKIVVYTNGTPPNHVLKLNGKVVGKPVNVEKEYPFPAGELRFNTDTIYLSRLKIKQQIVNMVNTGKKAISIVSIVKPDYIETDYTPFTLEKGMIGNLIIRYIGNGNTTFSPADRIVIRTNQGESFTFPLTR